jgi:hypothetical protein
VTNIAENVATCEEESMEYSEMLRKALKGDNEDGAPVTIRELSRRTAYPYELLRDVVKGVYPMSRELNQSICNALGIDETVMWRAAGRDV